MNKTGFVAILGTSESSMELRTRLKPHILSVQMTVKRSSGAFLGDLQRVCRLWVQCWGEINGWPPC